MVGPPLQRSALTQLSLGDTRSLAARRLFERVNAKECEPTRFQPHGLRGLLVTCEILFVVSVVGLAGALIVSGLLRLDVIALLVVLSLVLGGALTAREGLAGFGDPVVIMVAGLLVIGEMLVRTGVAHGIGNWLAGFGRDGEIRLILLLTLVAAALGSFMSNTAVVAILLPVVLSVASRTNLNAARLLLPLGYAALVSGMLTLIATPANLVVSAELARAGFEPFGFFAFTPIGVAVMGVFAVYMVSLGRHLLPGGPIDPPRTTARNVNDLLNEFGLLGTPRRMQVQVGSSLVGKTLAASEIGSRYDVRIIILERFGRGGPRIISTPAPELEIQAGDVLVLQGPVEAVAQVARERGLRALEIGEADRARWIREGGVAKVLIHPDSRLIGSSLRELGLRSSYGVQVLSVRRGNDTIEGFLDERLKSGDAMLVIGPWKRIQQLQAQIHDFVVLALPEEVRHIVPARQRAPVALAIVALMVLLSALKIVPVVIAVLLCSLLGVLTRCLTMEHAYTAIQWSSVVLIAGMLSLARAMEKSGADGWIAEQLIQGLGEAGPYVMMSALFALTAGLSAVLSGAATAVLLAPIAIRAAGALEIAPHAFAMTVAIAATSGYAVPASSPALMLIVGPGKYRLTDFLKVGIPMLLLTGLVTIALLPWLFPFR